MVAYTGGTQTACGTGQAAMGPFYCPNDNTIYIDPGFFNELSRRFQAPGDFAALYVIAHEVGHHVQNLEGTLDQAQQAQQSVGQTEGNRSRWGSSFRPTAMPACGRRTPATRRATSSSRATSRKACGRRKRSATTCSRSRSQGVVVPESFTHGSSAQRMQALQTGLAARGNPAACKFNR